MFFENWYALERIGIVGILAYVALIFWLRVFGKRTLAKWNAFDYVVTVAFGSILATSLLSKDTPLIEGVFAFIMLAALQFIITRLSLKFKFVENLIKAKPTMVFFQGEFLHEAMKSQRVAKSEILSAIRFSGSDALENIAAVVLETNGDLSVIKQSDNRSKTALQDVENYKNDKNSPRKQ
ncbi:MAG: DUF421 domain-containing protein [Acidobacteriota bacterium]|nr:DUF421 domain-containing protein [Acidobacteriota bacterium]